MGIVLSKKANQPVRATMATNRDANVATNFDTAVATNNTQASAVVEDEYWQTKCPAVVDRTKFIFNKELLSDVKFAVPVSIDKSESKKVRTKMIPAHKFVLAISSPVFFAMFYGQMAETRGVIKLSDCEYESLLELFRFLYYEEVNLSLSNVLQVLNLAKQYMVPSLVDKCTEYLRNVLEVSNVFHILVASQKFEEKDLEDRCWKVIETQTDEVVKSEEFFTLERSVVESVVKRESLNVKEIDVFRAVNRWATKKIKKQGKTPNGTLKRNILGEKIVKAIRFPLMSQREFASVVLDSGILSNEESGDMMKYYSNVSTSLPFIEVKRLKTNFPRCHRFSVFHQPDLILSTYEPSKTFYKYNILPGSSRDQSKWRYDDRSPDKIRFTVSKPIKLCGVQHFGSSREEYTVSLQVKDIAYSPPISLGKQFGKYTSTQNDGGFNYDGFDVMFDRPVALAENTQYELESLIKGPVSWYGERGQTSVESEGVLFTFFMGPYDRGDRTNVSRGQFPSFLFT